MSLTNYVNRIMVCLEIREGEAYWETLDGSFGIFMKDTQQPRDTKVNDVGILEYDSGRSINNKWFINNCKGVKYEE